MSAPVPSGSEDLEARIASVPLWYHTIDLAPGVSTPGWFDLRGIVDRIPWPDLAGARCLDVATYDGFLAFELERRGASVVEATDIDTHEGWDWLPRERSDGPAALEDLAAVKGRGFEVAREALRSSVERRWCSVYDLTPQRHGMFDVVVVGALLLHLREPFRALEAIRSVTRGTLLSLEQVNPLDTVLHPRRPLLHLDGHRQRWAVPNAAAHRRMLDIAGFDVEAQTTFSEPFGTGHELSGSKRREPRRRRARRTLERLRFGGVGIPTSAVRARPDPRLVTRETG